MLARLLTPYEQAVLNLHAAETEEEIILRRKELRELCLGDPLKFIRWGYRRPRKRRAMAKHLRRPTMEERAAAWDMLLYAVAVHEIEQHFNRRGIQMTRNWMSRHCGAR